MAGLVRQVSAMLDPHRRRRPVGGLLSGLFIVILLVGSHAILGGPRMRDAGLAMRQDSAARTAGSAQAPGGAERALQSADPTARHAPAPGCSVGLDVGDPGHSLGCLASAVEGTAHL